MDGVDEKKSARQEEGNQLIDEIHVWWQKNLKTKSVKINKLEFFNATKFKSHLKYQLFTWRIS